MNKSRFRYNWKSSEWEHRFTCADGTPVFWTAPAAQMRKLMTVTIRIPMPPQWDVATMLEKGLKARG